MTSVATGPSKPSFQCLYLDGSVRKSTRMVSPSAMSGLPGATGLSQNDPERLGPLRAEILPAVRRAAVEQRAVTGLEQVAVAGVVQGDLAVDHVEELHLAALDDDLLGRDPALLGPERRDDRADLALEEPGAQHRPALRRAVEADDGVVLPAGHHDRAGGLAVEERADRHAERRRDPAQRVERRREPPRLDLRHHARREVRLLRELPLLQLALGAQALDALAERSHAAPLRGPPAGASPADRKSTRLNSSHGYISYAVFCLKKKKTPTTTTRTRSRRSGPVGSSMCIGSWSCRPSLPRETASGQSRRRPGSRATPYQPSESQR